MAKLEKIEFIKVPNIRVIGVEVAHSIAEGVENPIPAVWEQCFSNGTVDMLKRLPRALSDCTIGWMGDAKGQDFKYIIGVAAVENTPVPEGMQYRDLPACDMAKGYIYGNLQNGDVYCNALNLTVEGIKANNFDTDYSVSWSAEVYSDDMSCDEAGLNAEYGAIYYLCPYKKPVEIKDELKTFVEKSKTEIVTIEEEIKVVGLSLEKSGFPKQFEKLGDMWGIYESKQREKVTNIKIPLVNYGFCFNKPDNDYDYLVGSAVVDVGDIDDRLTSYTIPAGRYIKASFNAKDFSDLVCGNGIRNSFEVAKKYAEENNLKIKEMSVFPVGGIEVYPHDMMCVGKENGPEWGGSLDNELLTTPKTQYPEMYTLTPIE